MRHRVVITGMGINTSLGAGVDHNWARLTNGDTGIRRISFWDPGDYQTKVAAEATSMPREVGLESYPGVYCRRTVRLFTPAVREAMADASLEDSDIDRRLLGVSLGSSVNYLDMSLMRRYFSLSTPGRFTMDLRRLLETAGELPVSSFFRRSGDTLTSVAARLVHAGGPAISNDTACAASLHAIGEAFRMVRRGEVRAMVAGGAAALVSPLSILAFAIIGALSRSEDPATASRPFDRQRDGFVMGEGAGCVVLESLESAQQRGAKIYAEVAGFGATLNAHTLTDPSPGGVAEAACMRQALTDGGVAPEEIGYVAAHGTSTPKNDSTETQAIKAALGGNARHTLVSSNKGQLGHTISAAGVLNTIFAVQAIRYQLAPATVNWRNADPECDLDYVPNTPRPAALSAALVNAFAFGGQNAVLALRAWRN